jgi:predicted NBD/HSP70 family sugar kinase
MNGPSELGQRSETVRRANLSAIVSEIHRDGSLTRSDLVARTGLTRSAIRGLVGELVQGGLLREGPATLDGTPGRPSPVVRPDPAGPRVLALEIAVDSLAVATVGLGGEIGAMRRIELHVERSSLDDVVEALAALVDSMSLRPASDESLVGIGVAIVGIVRRTDGMISMAPNLGWRDEPFGERLQAALQTDLPIVCANEADLAALAESRRGAARGVPDVIVIWGSVGVGGGLIIDGEQRTGAAGYGGEVGHIPVNPDGLPCHCGSVGCWETEVGTGAVLRRAGHPAETGSDGLQAVLRDAIEGAPAARAALAETGRWLGIGLSGLINTLNPHLVLLGGRLAAMYPFVRASLEAELDRRVLRASRHLVRVMPATLGVESPLVGAAELAFEPLLDDPSAWLRDHGATTDLATA